MGRNVLLVEDDPRNILSYGYGPRSKLYPSPRLLPDAIPRKPEARLADKASLAFTTRTRLFEPFPRKQIFPKIISSFYGVATTIGFLIVIVDFGVFLRPG